MNEARCAQTDGDGPKVTQIDLLSLRGYAKRDLNSYAITVMDELFGREELFKLRFGFNLSSGGTRLKFNMPPDQAAIVERK